MGFFDGVDGVEAYENRTPLLGLGTFLVEVVGTHLKHSTRQSKDYFQVDFKIKESDAPGFAVGTEACIQIWPATFQIHLRKIKALVEAALPGKKVTAKLCSQLVEEDLLCGAQLRIVVTKNAGGYPEPEYSVA